MRFTDAQFAQALAEPIAAIGRSDFEERLLAFLGRLVRHDMRTMTRYSRFTKPDYLVHSEDYPKPMVERYLKDYYRFDPFFLYWQKHERPGVVWM